ncbi:MAG: hypothetical protein IKD14_00300 [Clostridia bacterium]|nr:hypothetical protein [Clostridia bacterium]
MNLIFTVTIILSGLLLTIKAPSDVIPTMSGAVASAVKLSLELLVVNTLWFGVLEVMKSGPIGRFLTKLLRGPINLLYGRQKSPAKDLIATNLACNILGLGQAATASGIEAERILEGEGDAFGQTMLFVASSTCIQVFPTSIITLRAGFGSLSPEGVLLPIILTSAVNFITAILLTKIFVKR